jgi:hypothetical protein
MGGDIQLLDLPLTLMAVGRLGRPLYEVDEDGTPVSTAEGGYRELTDARIRHTYNGEALTEAVMGLLAAKARWATVTNSVENLRHAVHAMAVVPDYEGGGSLVKREGWDPQQIAEARDDLDLISRKLADWADRQRYQNNEQDKDSGLEATDRW